MKKFIALLLSIILLISLSTNVFAFIESDGDGISENSSAFSCVFNSKKNVIEIKGTINHDVLVKYDSYTISVYKIPFGLSVNEAISNPDNKVISNSEITIKYEYAIKVTGIVDRFVKYIVVLCSPEGNVYPASSAKIPIINGNYDYNSEDKSAFKGIETFEVAAASNASPSTAVIEVNLDTLYGNASNCYLYPMGDTYAYLDKNIISDIDGKVLALSQAGARVYIRFLLSSGGNITSISDSNAAENVEELPYAIPDVYNAETLNFICAAASFMAERYCKPDKMQVHGIVLGTQADDIKNVNNAYGNSFEEYIYRYVIYLLAVAKSMRNINSEIDIVVPISDYNDYSDDLAENNAYSAEFLEGISSIIEDTVSDEPIFSVMVEVKETPFSISNENINKSINLEKKDKSNERIGIENIEYFNEFFDTLSQKFDSAPQSYSVLWNVPAELSGNALACAYAYSYYKLFNFENVSSFIVSFSEGEKHGVKKFDELSLTFKYINTKETFEVTENLLKYFDIDSWSELLSVKNENDYSVKDYFELNKSDSVFQEINGSFEYFEFNSSVNTSRWKNGINTKFSQIEYSDKGERALHITSTPVNLGEYFEIYHIYDSPETLKYTPYISFDISFDKSKTVPILFEVNVILGNDNSIASASYSAKSGENKNIILDVSEFNEVNDVQYLKISVRPLTANDESISMWINSVRGYSENYTDEELSNHITEYRLKTQDGLQEDKDSDSSRINIFTVLGISITLIVIGIGLFIIFKREE